MSGNAGIFSRRNDGSGHQAGLTAFGQGRRGITKSHKANLRILRFSEKRWQDEVVQTNTTARHRAVRRAQASAKSDHRHVHLIQALLLWSFVSALIVGAALAFRRIFPDESPWFGFIVPPLGLVAALNFIEHFVALPNLLPLLPPLVLLIGWLAASAKYSRREILLPALIFLGSFAFTFGIRLVQPDILPTSDGLSDLNKINNYCQGDTLPPIDTWMPPYHYVWYYSLQHYAASIIKRLFGVKLGVAYNTAHALLSALTCVAGAAAAHRISDGRIWITALIPFLIESAATGSSAYIQLTTAHPSPWLANNISGGVLAPPDDHRFWKWLALDPYRERLELQVPGFWTWRDEYHANMAGHFLTLCSVFVIAELVLVRRTIWPWIMAVIVPVLAVISSTWAYPISLLLCGGMCVIALICHRRPASYLLGGTILGASLLLLWPSFYDVTVSPQVPDIIWTDPAWRAPWREFFVQWWPIILLWIYGCFHFRAISPAVRWILFVIPLMLIGVELITVEGRYNTVEKMWGYTYGTGLIALFPIVAQRSLVNITRSVASYEAWPTLRIIISVLSARVITGLLVLSAGVSMFGWLHSDLRLPSGDISGDHYLTSDDQKKKMLQVLSQVKRTTFLSGKCIWCYNEAPALAVFTGNRSYIAWSYFESVADYPEVATYREKLNNDFYSGAMTDPLKFLRANKVSGVLIWPDDDISDDLLATLTKALDPAFEYIDCRGTGDKNAGVFLARPMPDAP